MRSRRFKLHRHPGRRIKGCRFVIHCAALASDWGAWKDFREANDDGVARLLKACEAVSLDRFVHISTTDVYGYPDRDGLDETTPFAIAAFPIIPPKFPASYTLWAAIDAGLAGDHHSTRLDLWSALCDPRYGDRRLSSQWRSSCTFGRVNAGFVYVENCVDLILLAMIHPAAVGFAFHSIDEGGQTWHDYFVAICRALNLRMPRWSVPRTAAYSWEVDRKYTEGRWAILHGRLLPEQRSRSLVPDKASRWVAPGNDWTFRQSSGSRKVSVERLPGSVREFRRTTLACVEQINDSCRRTAATLETSLLKGEGHVFPVSTQVQRAVLCRPKAGGWPFPRIAMKAGPPLSRVARALFPDKAHENGVVEQAHRRTKSLLA